MPATISTLDRMRGPERALAAFVLFYGALVPCLPVPWSEDIAQQYPWWANRVEVGRVLLHELVFLVWIAIYGLPFVARALLDKRFPGRQAALWLIALALWCGLVSLFGPLPLLDLGRTLRLLINVALLLAVVRWTIRGGNLPLIMFVLGLGAGTVINLIISFQFPLIIEDTLRLSGQNTPGVVMGVGIHLSAWLFLRDRRLMIQGLAVVSALLFAFGCTLSFSRIGWFTGALGLIAWAYVLVLARPLDPAQRRRFKIVRRALVPFAVASLVFAATTSAPQNAIGHLQLLIEQKASNQAESNEERWAYVTGTIEILSSRPWGVGYSGFFDAMTATQIYLSRIAAEEESVPEANPHAAVLWYTTAGGIPGGVMAIVLFVALLKTLRAGMVSAVGRGGDVVFVLIALSFLVMSLTIVYIFNSMILIVPTGIAAGWGWSQRETNLVAPTRSRAKDRSRAPTPTTPHEAPS